MPVRKGLSAEDEAAAIKWTWVGNCGASHKAIVLPRFCSPTYLLVRMCRQRRSTEQPTTTTPGDPSMATAAEGTCPRPRCLHNAKSADMRATASELLLDRAPDLVARPKSKLLEHPLIIRSIEVAGLRGATPKGGWTAELGPDDVVHTLVAVHTDGGLTGYGSDSTNDELARAAVKVLRPYWEGENALEPETSEREAASRHLLARKGRDAHPRHQRDRHRPVGHSRQGDRPAGRSASRWALPGHGPARTPPCSPRTLGHGRDDRPNLPGEAFAPSRSAGDRSGRVELGDRRSDRGGRQTGCRVPSRCLWWTPGGATPSGHTATSGRCAPPRCSRTTTSPGSKSRSGPTTSRTSSPFVDR